jgi:O-antigen/teichoic acid export membrane protein
VTPDGSPGPADGPSVAHRRIAADISIQIVGRLLNAGLGVIATLVLIRALGDDGFGQWATVFAVVEVVGYLGEIGLEQLAVRRISADRRREAEWVGALVSLRFALAVPVTALVLIALFAISDDDEMRAISLIAAGTMFTGALSAARVVFQVRVRNDVSVVILTLNSVLWTLAVITLASGDGSMVAFALAFLITAAVTTILEYVWAVRTQPIRYAGSRRYWGDLIRGGVPLGIAGLVTMAYVRIDGILVFEIAGADEAGLYAAVYRVLDRVQMVPTAVMTTLLPLLAAAWPADPDRTRRLMQSAADLLLVTALPALALAVAAPAEIVDLLFGDEFEDAAPALPVLMGAFVALSLWHLALNMVIVLGRQRRLIVYTTAGLVVNVALNIALIPEFGFMAAAWITLATEVLVMALTLSYVLGQTGVRLRLRRMAATTLSAVVMGLACAALVAAGLHVAVVGVVGLLVYAAALLVLRAVDLGEVRLLLRRG